MLYNLYQRTFNGFYEKSRKGELSTWIDIKVAPQCYLNEENKLNFWRTVRKKDKV